MTDFEVRAALSSNGFWKALDAPVSESEIVIDRLKGSSHPRFNNFVYPLDYGYINATTAMDGGIDVWRGSDSTAD